MPIYEFACPKCRKIFNFLSKKMNPGGSPTCPQCGSKKLTKQMSAFAPIRGGESSSDESGEAAGGMPDLDDPKMIRAMAEMEKEMAHLDENNPKHMAHMMKKMKDMMPSGVMPKEMDEAIRRLESGEDPEKIEDDMGDVLSALDGGEAGGGGVGNYAQDPGLYDY